DNLAARGGVMMKMKLLAVVAVLSMLLASGAFAGQCQTYCGTFAGVHWCNTRCRGKDTEMWPVMIFLVLVVAVYWGAFYLTVAGWLNAIGHLFRGNFIRASIWFSVGCGMLFWWQGTEVIPHPWDFDAWLRGSAMIVGVGALGTFVRFYRRHQQAVEA